MEPDPRILIADTKGVKNDRTAAVDLGVGAGGSIYLGHVSPKIPSERPGEIQMPSETPNGQFSAAGTGGLTSSVRYAQTGVFRKEGEYWTVGCGGNSFRLKDTKGLGYLAHLLRHPRVEFHVLDLVGGIARHREEDETNRSVQGLPQGTEELEKAGI